ncbi:copper chaperone PCu(A)C [Roseococcus sp. SYP-B2431]|uniref:copper chaperone PCu(A)C n=1 Tax=Roseococcus sp. SYP-B2431 TaxID=2496640 RepID=UPI00103A81BE|nr:copper chaperone PCu(A)C [Roseococcus sp. SYP-B2431]TCI00308.1 copper chaperone PCu(A)C [Roseococcus sp. SYP-B2431]
MKKLLALLLATATPAAAHVTLDPAEAQPASYTRLAFRVGHGCGGAATTGIEVGLPRGMTVARPMPKPGWEIAIEPGASVAWRGGPLPDAWYDEFVMMVRTPDRGGEALAFPVTQHCGETVAAWTQPPVAGEPRPRFPAPMLQLAQAPVAVTAGPLALSNAWTRAAGQGGQGAGFVTIRNSGAEADRLVAASSPAATRVELHTSLREGDVMRMRPVENIPVPAGGSVTLAPGGLHLMLLGLTRPLAVGQTVPVTLRFERAGQVTVNLAVQAAGARAPTSMPGHRH